MISLNLWWLINTLDRLPSSMSILYSITVIVFVRPGRCFKMRYVTFPLNLKHVCRLQRIYPIGEAVMKFSRLHFQI